MEQTESGSGDLNLLMTRVAMLYTRRLGQSLSRDGTPDLCVLEIKIMEDGRNRFHWETRTLQTATWRHGFRLLIEK